MFVLPQQFFVPRVISLWMHWMWSSLSPALMFLEADQLLYQSGAS